MVGKSQDIIVKAVSTDPVNTKKIVSCEIKMTVMFTANEDMKIYETLLEMPRKYSANHPGDLFVHLNDRFMGPNMTFSTINW